jgi:hypothetical protein
LSPTPSAEGRHERRILRPCGSLKGVFQSPQGLNEDYNRDLQYRPDSIFSLPPGVGGLEQRRASLCYRGSVGKPKPSLLNPTGPGIISMPLAVPPLAPTSPPCPPPSNSLPDSAYASVRKTKLGHRCFERQPMIGMTVLWSYLPMSTCSSAAAQPRDPHRPFIPLPNHDRGPISVLLSLLLALHRLAML